jgi:hypothetical protein
MPRSIVLLIVVVLLLAGGLYFLSTLPKAGPTHQVDVQVNPGSNAN